LIEAKKNGNLVFDFGGDEVFDPRESFVGIKEFDLHLADSGNGTVFNTPDFSLGFS
jgi:hypothetical protein